MVYKVGSVEPDILLSEQITNGGKKRLRSGKVLSSGMTGFQNGNSYLAPFVRFKKKKTKKTKKKRRGL